MTLILERLTTKPKIPVRTSDDKLGTQLASWVKSKNIIMLAKFKHSGGTPIAHTQWYRVDESKIDLPKEIAKLYIRIDDSTAPSFRIVLAIDGQQIATAAFLNKPICKHGFRKVKAKDATKTNPAIKEKKPDDVRDDFFEDTIKNKKQGQSFIYKGSSYNSQMKKAFKTAYIES